MENKSSSTCLSLWVLGANENVELNELKPKPDRRYIPQLLQQNVCFSGPFTVLLGLGFRGRMGSFGARQIRIP